MLTTHTRSVPGLSNGAGGGHGDAAGGPVRPRDSSRWRPPGCWLQSQWAAQEPPRDATVFVHLC